MGGRQLGLPQGSSTCVDRSSGGRFFLLTSVVVGSPLTDHAPNRGQEANRDGATSLPLKRVWDPSSWHRNWTWCPENAREKLREEK